MTFNEMAHVGNFSDEFASVFLVFFAGIFNATLVVQFSMDVFEVVTNHLGAFSVIFVANCSYLKSLVVIVAGFSTNLCHFINASNTFTKRTHVGEIGIFRLFL